MRKFASIIISFLFVFTGFKFLSAQAPPKPGDGTIKGSQTFAIIVGVSAYKYVPPLTYADKDAEMFRDFLKSPAGGKIPDDNIYCLLNEEASAMNFFVGGFKWLKAKNLQKGDRLFIYFAGHGDAINEDEFFFLAYDCNPAGNRNNYLVGGTIQMWSVKTKIGKEVSKGIDVFLIMDACRSNEPEGGFLEQSFSNPGISEKGAEVTMLATGAGNAALESKAFGNGHGLFTYYLVDGLIGAADTDSNYIITVEEIQRYINNNVSAAAQKSFRKTQNPYISISDNQFRIVNLVDTAYNNKWTKSKMRQADAFNGEINDYSTTISYHRSVLDIEPTKISSYTAIGLAFMEQNKPDSALVYFKAACELNPGSKTAVLNLGLVYHMLGYYEKAIKQAQDAIRLDIYDSKAYYQLACSYAVTGNYPEAVKNLQKALIGGYTDKEKILSDPNLSTLKNNEPFQALLDKYIPGWRERSN